MFALGLLLLGSFPWRLYPSPPACSSCRRVFTLTLERDLWGGNPQGTPAPKGSRPTEIVKTFGHDPLQMQAEGNNVKTEGGDPSKCRPREGGPHENPGSLGEPVPNEFPGPLGRGSLRDPGIHWEPSQTHDPNPKEKGDLNGRPTPSHPHGTLLGARSAS